MVQPKKMVYSFDEGDASMRELLGGKGANLCEMAKLGLPVPPGFIITTEACLDYYDLDHQLPEGLWDQVQEKLHGLESTLGRKLGSTDNPLLVSVRSGARISMPGMMDTILNLGVSDDNVDALARHMNDERPAYDAYRRFLQIFASIVLGMEAHQFEVILSGHKERTGKTLDHELSPDELRQVIADFKAAIREHTGRDVPQDPQQQLFEAVQAVFQSWNSPRAISYRDHYSIPHTWGTGVNVMGMVFGNLGDDSGTGVLFTRNPVNGARELYGEYLVNGQGEDVVAGIRNPEPFSVLSERNAGAHATLSGFAGQLEDHYRDMQDIEFTVEGGRLYLLQTRNAQRTVQAAVRIAVEMVEEGLISRQEAVQKVVPEEMTQLFVPRFDEDSRAQALAGNAYMAQGFGASPGAATGKAYFDATRAAEAAAQDIPVILIRPETKPDDIHGILAAKGVLTSRGGVTSHAAVVTRGLGVPCVVGCEALHVDVQSRTCSASGRTISEGEDISIDATSGEVLAGSIPTFQPQLDEVHEAQVLLGWADEYRRLGVFANADTPTDAQRAVSMGAEGIGLCRTEHMFLGPERVEVVQRMLVNAQEAEGWAKGHPDEASRRSPMPGQPDAVHRFYEALEHLKGLQIEDFTGILQAMGNQPVIIRLLDAPLHEFLPRYEDLVRSIVTLEAQGAPEGEIEPHRQQLQLVESLREANPMLGHRGCRLGLTFPAIYEMQVEAIITASANLIREGIMVHPEIMIPLISHVNELKQLQVNLTGVAESVQAAMGTEVDYKYGTMVEVPRACMTADDVAQVAEFFSFGTNDLTQMTYGFSRDDAEGKFLNQYIQNETLPSNPFMTIDPEGVGGLIRIGVQKGRSVRPDLEVGICGEHGGDPASVAFCHREGLDYVSCSPFRVPIARLAAAQAALEGTAGGDTR